MWRNRARIALGHVSYSLSMISYFAFSIYTGVRGRRNPEFHQCYGGSGFTYGYTIVLTLVGSIANIAIMHPTKYPILKLVAPLFSILSWPVTFVTAISILSLQSITLYGITEKFQAKSQRMSSENQFGFGQFLVFFLVLQLILDFSIALYSE